MCLAQKGMVFIDNAWTTSDYNNVFTNLKKHSTSHHEIKTDNSYCLWNTAVFIIKDSSMHINGQNPFLHFLLV